MRIYRHRDRQWLFKFSSSWLFAYARATKMFWKMSKVSLLLFFYFFFVTRGNAILVFSSVLKRRRIIPGSDGTNESHVIFGQNRLGEEINIKRDVGRSRGKRILNSSNESTRYWINRRQSVQRTDSNEHGEADVVRVFFCKRNVKGSSKIYRYISRWGRKFFEPLESSKCSSKFRASYFLISPIRTHRNMSRERTRDICLKNSKNFILPVISRRGFYR